MPIPKQGEFQNMQDYLREHNLPRVFSPFFSSMSGNIVEWQQELINRYGTVEFRPYAHLNNRVPGASKVYYIAFENAAQLEVPFLREWIKSHLVEYGAENAERGTPSVDILQEMYLRDITSRAH